MKHLLSTVGRTKLEKLAMDTRTFFHGSPEDLETLELRVPPNHTAKGVPGEAAVYAAESPIAAALYALARNSSKGSWGVSKDNRLIMKSTKELNPFGYVYELESSDYTSPPEDNLALGFAIKDPKIKSKKRVSAAELQEYIDRVETTEELLQQMGLSKTSSDKPKSAVIIKGNPYYIEQGPDADNYSKYYKEIENELRSAGYGDISFDRGDENTTPRNADLWVGHSRGSSRLKFAPKGTKTFDTTQYEDGVEEYKAILLKAMLEKGYSSLHEFPVEERPRPGSEHYTITDRMREALRKTSSARGQLEHFLYKRASLEDTFTPDFTPDDLKALGVYDQVYGDAPREASMKEWPAHWINEQDPLGWLQWYERYSGGRRTEDDARQIKRWNSFKARHLAQYLKNPTPRRAAALRNWGIDVEKHK
jgi:hypothetical protein